MAFFSCILLMTAIIYIKRLWEYSNIAPVAMILPVFEVIWYTASLMWIEKGIYITEEARYSYYSGATIKYLILIVPFFIAYLFITRNNAKVNCHFCEQKQVSSIERKLLLLGLLLNLYCFIDLMYSGCPRFDFSMGKFTYYDLNSKLPFAVHTRGGLLYFFLVVAGITLVKTEKKIYKILAWTICLSALLNSYLLRCKFYGYYNIFFLFIMPFLFQVFCNSKRKKLNELISKKTIIVCAAFIGLILTALWINYRANSNPFDAFMNRLLALQGHVFWGCKNEMSLWPDVKRIKIELQGIIKGVNLYDRNFGLAYAMQVVSPQTIVNEYLNHNVLFYGSYVITSSITIGYIATVLYSVLLAIYYAFISKVLFHFINDEYFIGLYLILELFYDFYNYFRIGTYSLLINAKSVIFLLCILFLYFVKPIKIKIRKHK